MADSVPETLGKRIAEYRERRKWTQKQLAEAAKLSVTYVSELENDHREAGSETLLRIADALGASLDYLLRGETRPEPQRRPLIIPPELAEAADEEDWPLGNVIALLKAKQIVLARRSRDSSTDRSAESLTKGEWKRLYADLGFSDEPTK